MRRQNLKYLDRKVYIYTHISILMHRFNLPIYSKNHYYKTQRCTFEVIIKRYHSEGKNEWKDLFCEFWIDFVPGTGMSINKFLYVDVVRRELKRGFVNGG